MLCVFPASTMLKAPLTTQPLLAELVNNILDLLDMEQVAKKNIIGQVIKSFTNKALPIKLTFLREIYCNSVFIIHILL